MPLLGREHRDARGRFLKGNPSRWIPRVKPRPGRLKRCTRCLDWFALDCFTKSKASPDGREWRCKDCRNKRRRYLHRCGSQGFHGRAGRRAILGR